MLVENLNCSGLSPKLSVGMGGENSNALRASALSSAGRTGRNNKWNDPGGSGSYCFLRGISRV